MPIRLSDALADQTLGQHDGEHQHGDDAASVEQELNREEKGGVEQEEDDGGGHQRARQAEDGVKEVGREDDTQAGGE